MRKTVSGIMLTLLLASILTLAFSAQLIGAERRLGVKVGDWVKYEYVTIVAAGGYPWVKFDVQSVEATKVTVLWTTGGPSGVSVPSGMPTFGLTVSWDVATGEGAFSYFIIHVDAKVGDSVNVMGLIPLQIQGETTRTYAGVSRTVVYVSYSSFGLSYTYYWDKQTGVLVEYSWTMAGVQFTMKAVETNLWQAGFGGAPLWIIGVIIAIVAAVTITIIFLWKKRPATKEQAGEPNIGKQQTGTLKVAY